MNFLEGLAERAVRAGLSGLHEGRLTVTHGGASTTWGSGDGPIAHVTVHDDAFWRAVALGGQVGAAESYVAGDWTTPDLTALVRLFVRNRELLDGLEGGLARFAQPLRAAIHAFNRNTREGSKRNIRAHYDLGNDFFRLFLDETLTYSAGVFERPGASMKDASTAKYDRLCRKLAIGPDDHVVEIGTGWGGFALHAAGTYGCRITTTTISREQHALATERVRAAGLEDRVEVLLRDYRELEGTYDKLVSIEMIEAVGHHYLDGFFARCSDLLEPDGLLALQAITVPDWHYDRHKSTVDFIKRYIFPGGCLTSVTDMTRVMTERTDMRVIHLEDIGPHYATTLRHWHDRFFAKIDEVRELGYSDEFIRMWQFYLCYCEGGFLERQLGDAHLLFTKPACRRAPIASVRI